MPTKPPELMPLRLRKTHNKLSSTPSELISNKLTKIFPSVFLSLKEPETSTPKNSSPKPEAPFWIMPINLLPRLNLLLTRPSPSKTLTTSPPWSSTMSKYKMPETPSVCLLTVILTSLLTDWSPFKNFIFSNKKVEKTISAEHFDSCDPRKIISEKVYCFDLTDQQLLPQFMLRVKTKWLLKTDEAYLSKIHFIPIMMVVIYYKFILFF